MADKKKVEQGSAAMSSTSGAETAVDASASGGGARPKTKEQKITVITTYFLLVEIGKEKKFSWDAKFLSENSFQILFW